MLSSRKVIPLNRQEVAKSVNVSFARTATPNIYESCGIDTSMQYLVGPIVVPDRFIVLRTPTQQTPAHTRMNKPTTILFLLYNAWIRKKRRREVDGIAILHSHVSAFAREAQAPTGAALIKEIIM